MLFQNLNILILQKTFYFDKLENADFKCNNKSFKFLLKSSRIRHFWYAYSFFLVLHEILNFNNFESADLKYGNSFLKLQPKNSELTPFKVGLFGAGYRWGYAYTLPKICHIS